MKSVSEVKSVIFKTECKKYIYEGLSCSEPIMSLHEGNIVDNYFIYSHNEDFTKISEPLISFGIFTDLERVAYIKQCNGELECRVIDEDLFDLERANDAYNEYVEVYPEIREIAFSKEVDCESVSNLERYLRSLFTFSGNALWQTYTELYPQFFMWAKELIKDSKGGTK